MRFLPIALAMAALASPASAETISVALQGVKKNSGSIVVCLWDKDADFPNCEEGQPVKRIVLPATAKSATFEDVANGTYAVSAFHDANANGRLDTNFLGLPKEAVGLSNNPRLMGPPRFKSALFDVAGETAIVLKFQGM
ncbi:MAG: DUF2141 domain-containing protein [Erythrobacter sp.]|jgi:uncharacterized protein (DUF2141 family)|nr:DUF2141 domain-containing protein [Erythrobacter sp.]